MKHSYDFNLKVKRLTLLMFTDLAYEYDKVI